MGAAPLTPLRLPFAVQVEARNSAANKDARIINGYVEKEPEGAVMMVKRPGIAVASNSTFFAAVATAGRGFWGRYVVSGTNPLAVNVYNTQTGASMGTIVINATGFIVTFADYVGQGVNIFVNANANWYTFVGTTITVIAAPAANAATYVNGVVFLDGTLYMMTTDAIIYGSAINDPTTWPALNRISLGTNAFAAGTGRALFKQKAYVVALTTNSTSVFYDAANASGSPLSPLPGGQSSIGCFDGNTVQCLGDDAMWLGQIDGGAFGVFLMRDLKISKVSNPAVDRLITFAGGVFRSAQMSTPGHRFYVLTIVGGLFSLVYDLETGYWYEWITQDGVPLPYFNSMTVGIAYPSTFQHTNGRLYTADENRFLDDDGQFTTTIYTGNWDGGNRFKKTMEEFSIIGDQVASTLDISYSEDDYQTFSTARTVNLAEDLPRLTNCGTFRRRAYRAVHSANTALRLVGGEMRLAPGTQ